MMFEYPASASSVAAWPDMLPERQYSFETAYGRELSESAGIGYDIGRLLDLLIAETDGALPDLAAIDRIAATAQSQLTFIRIVDADELPPASAEIQPVALSDNDRSRTIQTVMVGLAVAVGTLMIGFHKQRSGRIKRRRHSQ